MELRIKNQSLNTSCKYHVEYEEKLGEGLEIKTLNWESSENRNEKGMGVRKQRKEVLPTAGRGRIVGGATFLDSV